MEEIWKDIAGYDGKYKISNMGNVISTKCWNGKGMIFLKQYLSQKGYRVVFLSKNSKAKAVTVHRLVAQSFIDNPNNYPQVNHINENKEDNRVENLEWCSAKYNMNYGTRKQKQIMKTSRPVKCVETGIIYKSAAEAARKNYPVRQGNITLCCQHKNNTACGFHWEYVH